MSEFEATILQRLAALESEVSRLKKSGGAVRAADFDDLPETATVGREYIAHRFGCSIRAVERGEAGTRSVKYKSKTHKTAIKRDVDAAWRAYSAPASERAAEARAKAKQRRRSILPKTTI